MREPNIIEGVGHVRIADKLLQNNEIWLEGEVTTSEVDKVISLLHIIEQRCTNEDGIINGDVRLFIAGPGGAISPALNLANYLKNTPLRVTTVCINTCASASAIIWLAGTRREILPHSRLMFHEVKHFVREDGSYSIEKIKELVADHLEIDVAEITDTTTFKDLDADSLDTVEILMEIEDEFGVEVKQGEIGETVADLAAYIDSKK